jgi:hypothetical protein
MTMNELFAKRVEAIYDYINTGASPAHLERLERRHRDLSQPEVLTAENATLCDVNRLVEQVVADALPICRDLGVPVRLLQAVNLPRVRMLIRPIEHTLAGLVDLCLDEADVAGLMLTTSAELDRVVVQIERRIGSDGDGSLTWRELRLGPRLEFVVGAQALRAVGGRMVVRQRANQIVARVELPVAEYQPRIDDIVAPGWAFRDPKRHQLIVNNRLNCTGAKRRAQGPLSSAC